MELVKIEDLEAGDEIVISCQSYFKYLKVLAKPRLSGKKHYHTGRPLYKMVKCSTIRINKTQTYVHNGGTHSYDRKEWGFGPDDHNFTQYIDLDYRQILLAKKN